MVVHREQSTDGPHILILLDALAPLASPKACEQDILTGLWLPMGKRRGWPRQAEFDLMLQCKKIP
jgi:hypothetical protein